MILFLVVLNLVFIAAFAVLYWKFEDFLKSEKAKIQKELQDKLASEFAKAQALKSQARIQLNEAELTKKEAAATVKSITKYAEDLKKKTTKQMSVTERVMKREKKLKAELESLKS